MTLPASTPTPEDLEFPRSLDRLLRALRGVSFLMVLLVPVAAAAESLVLTGPTLIDAGGSTPIARAVINCLVLVCSVFALLLPPAEPRDARVTRVPAAALAGFVAIWLVASLTSVCVPDSLLNAMGWIVAACFFYVCREIADTRRALEQVLHALLAVSALVVFVSFRLYFASAEEHPAMTGPFYQADVAAGFFLLLVPVAVALLIGADRWDQRVFYGGMSLALLTSLVLTYSRGGLLAVSGALVIVAVLMFPRRRLAALLVPVAIFGGAFAAAGLIASGGRAVVPVKTLNRAAELVAAATERPTGTLAERAGREADTSVTARVNFYRGGWRMALARPALGWGPATFGRVFPRYQDDVRFYSKYAHSAYITIVSEAGFLGALAFLIFLLALGVAASRQYRAAAAVGVWNAAAVTGLIAGLAGVLAHVLVDVDWEFQMLLVLFMGKAGLLTCRGAMSSDPTEEAELPLTTRGQMTKRWLLCLPVMALIAIQPFPFLSQFAEAASVAARQDGNLDEAIAHQRQAVAYMPYNSGALRQLGETLLVKVESATPSNRAFLEEAIAVARRSVTLDPYRAVNLDLLGRVLIAAGDPAGGEEAERAAIADDPVNYPKFYNIVAELLVQAGRDTEALALLSGIAQRYPPKVFPTMWFFRQDSLKEQLSQTWFLIGTMRLKAGRLDDAIAAFTRAVELNGDNITARFQLGTLYLNTGRAGLAYPHVLAIQRRKPAHPVSKWIMGLCCRALGQFAHASTLLDDAYKAMPALRETKGGVRIPRDFFIVEPTPPTVPMHVVPR